MSSQQALNRAMREAVEFVHAEGWDAPPTLFALVPREFVAAALGESQLEDSSDDAAELTLIVQDSLPDNTPPGSEELADYVSRISWPAEVTGVILAQEIRFRDSSAAADAPGGELPPARAARLFSGVLREEDIELTLLQLRPTEAELAEGGLFAEDRIELRGGPEVAPGVIAALRYGLDFDGEEGPELG